MCRWRANHTNKNLSIPVLKKCVKTVLLLFTDNGQQRPSNISRLQYLVTRDSGGQKARWQGCQRCGDTHYDPGTSRAPCRSRAVFFRWCQHPGAHHAMLEWPWGACHEAREYSGASETGPGLSRYVGKWWELRELRENDRVPLIWAESMVRELRDGDTPLYPSSLLYWYPGSPHPNIRGHFQSSYHRLHHDLHSLIVRARAKLMF